MAAFEANRMLSSRDFVRGNPRLEDTRLPSLLPPRPPEQQETTSPRDLASAFTRKREPADTKSELMSALVPLTQLITAAKSSTSPSEADSATVEPTPKPKRKRIRLKTERRRQQCRNNQARYRDRQRGFVRELEEGVQQLQVEIQRLTVRRHTLCYGAQTKSNVWNVVVEYFRLLRYGFLMPFRGMETSVDSSSESELRDQEYFLRATMADNVAIGELTGVEALIEQWKRYSSYFGSLHLQLKRMEEQPLGAMVATATLSLTITEATLRCVFPHLLATGVPHAYNEGIDRNSSLYYRLLTQRLECPCTVRFMWDDTTGRVTRLDSTMDLLSPLLRVLSSLEDVSYVLGEALITPSHLIGEVQT
ncbi:hypothetical protein ON010_g12910 [Phytophthora cinnamomi]|nr:hypothetical protein ON010_g12910 [Phytophthora cinnamomi]